MVQPYVGEIRLVAFGFAPSGWAPCDGRSLAPSEYPDLFGAIGTTFGGDGRSSFNMPDLRGRIPRGAGSYPVGAVDGVESVTLTSPQLPGHMHPVRFTAAPAQLSPAGALLASPQSTVSSPLCYADMTLGVTPIDSLTITPIGGSQPHENRQPYLGLSFIIATGGAAPAESAT